MVGNNHNFTALHKFCENPVYFFVHVCGMCKCVCSVYVYMHMYVWMCVWCMCMYVYVCVLFVNHVCVLE